MNKSVCENCIAKCIMVSFRKNSPKSRFFQAGLPEYPLKKKKRKCPCWSAVCSTLSIIEERRWATSSRTKGSPGLPALAWILEASRLSRAASLARSWQNLQGTSFDFVQSGRDKETKRALARRIQIRFGHLRTIRLVPPSTTSSADLKVTANACRGSRKGEMNFKLRLTKPYTVQRVQRLARDYLTCRRSFVI